MAEPFLGEIRLFSFGYAPQWWATCDGQTMNIVQNQALFALLGTTFGGNGTTTFKLPDFRGRTLLHRSAAYPEGTAGGTETVALTSTSQLLTHTHALMANSAAGGTNNPQSNVPAAVQDTAKSEYATAKATPAVNLAAGTLSSAGASAGHDNMQPSLTINYCIALMGVFPSRN